LLSAVAAVSSISSCDVEHLCAILRRIDLDLDLDPDLDLDHPDMLRQPPT
jgi:hypothetical protein